MSIGLVTKGMIREVSIISVGNMGELNVSIEVEHEINIEVSE